MGLSSAFALRNASCPQGIQSTGFWACCSRYGDVSPARRLPLLSPTPASPGPPGAPPLDAEVADMFWKRPLLAVLHRPTVLLKPANALAPRRGDCWWYVLTRSVALRRKRSQVIVRLSDYTAHTLQPRPLRRNKGTKRRFRRPKSFVSDQPRRGIPEEVTRDLVHENTTKRNALDTRLCALTHFYGSLNGIVYCEVLQSSLA